MHQQGNRKLWLGTCDQTRKRQYRNRGDARSTKRLIARQQGEKLSEWSVYVCDYGQYFHIGHNGRKN